MKKVSKAIIFVLVFIIIWKIIFNIFWYKNPISQFYDEPKNSLDIVFVGSSNAYTHYNGMLAFQEYGLATGMLSAGNLPPSAIKFLLEEGSKYQKPYVYIVDLSVAYLLPEDGAIIRRVTDTLKFSKNKLEATKYMLKYTNVDKKDYINYYLSFLFYHNGWKNISSNSFVNEEIIKGHYLSENTLKIKYLKSYKWNDEYVDVSPEIKEIFADLIAYLQDKKLEIIFTIAPRIYTDEEMGQLNTLTKLLTDNGFEVINTRNLENLNIKYDHDFYNPTHLNIYGTIKYTRAFSEFLKQRYDIPDHRGDKKYNSWNTEYARYKNVYHKLTNKNYEDLLK